MDARWTTAMPYEVPMNWELRYTDSRNAICKVRFRDCGSKYVLQMAIVLDAWCVDLYSGVTHCIQLQIHEDGINFNTIDGFENTAILLMGQYTQLLMGVI